MNLNISLSLVPFAFAIKAYKKIQTEKTVICLAVILAVLATVYSYFHNIILVYGDAESHINISKRVIDSLTPGFAQLGGVWLPLPHLLMTPLTASDFLWRTGLAGSIVSGGAFIAACVYSFKLTKLLTKNSIASFFAFLVFALNPNILYMQSTPMTELPLIAFYVVSIYYFIRYLKSRDAIGNLILAAAFGFCAALSRYDGWFLVLAEAGLLILYFLPYRNKWRLMEGRVVLFSSLAFFAIFLWLLWNYLILGDPFYFTNSVYSAKSQQSSWLQRGELPGYHNIAISFLYYFVTSMSISGILLFLTSLIGLAVIIKDRKNNNFYYTVLLLFIPFLFYLTTLFDGQSVIFIPSLTPTSYEWRLFNVRYGLMMIPFVAFLLGYLFTKATYIGRFVLGALLLIQSGLFIVGYSHVLTLDDGTVGLSSSKKTDAQSWLSKNYDGGLVLIDDYARSISIIKSNIPMNNIINVGNKPYYQDSFVAPEKYAKWIIIQRDDDIWNHIYADTGERDRLYKYFQKAYTSDKILIFKRNPSVS